MRAGGSMGAPDLNQNMGPKSHFWELVSIVRIEANSNIETSLNFVEALDSTTF